MPTKILQFAARPAPPPGASVYVVPAPGTPGPRPLDDREAWALADRIANAAGCDLTKEKGAASLWTWRDNRAGVRVHLMTSYRPMIDVAWIEPDRETPATWAATIECGLPGRPVTVVPAAVPWEPEWVEALLRILAIAAAAA